MQPLFFLNPLVYHIFWWISAAAALTFLFHIARFHLLALYSEAPSLWLPGLKPQSFLHSAISKTSPHKYKYPASILLYLEAGIQNSLNTNTKKRRFS